MSHLRYGDPEERKRTEAFAKDQEVEHFLRKLNTLLLPLEDELMEG